MESLRFVTMSTSKSLDWFPVELMFSLKSVLSKKLSLEAEFVEYTVSLFVPYSGSLPSGPLS